MNDRAVKNLLRYLWGYVVILVMGDFPKRFMNLCSLQGIEIWNLEKMNVGYRMSILLKDFFCIKPLARKTNVSVKVLHRRGVPFLLRRQRHKPFFFIGMFACILILLISTNYVWKIEFYGNYMMTEELLLDFLATKQVEQGVKKSDIDCAALEEQLREAYPVISWVCVKKEGTLLRVDIKEQFPNVKEESFQKKDIISQYDGVIAGIVTRRGIPKVTTGDEVKKGDVLVEHLIEIHDDAGEVVKVNEGMASADILIQTKFPYQDDVKRRYVEKYYDRTHKGLILIVNGHVFKTPVLKESGQYDEIVEYEQKVLPIFQPVCINIGKVTHCYYHESYRTYSDEELQNILKKHLAASIEEMKKKGVQMKQIGVKIRTGKTSGRAKGWLLVVTKNQ